MNLCFKHWKQLRLRANCCIMSSTLWRSRTLYGLRRSLLLACHAARSTSSLSSRINFLTCPGCQLLRMIGRISVMCSSSLCFKLGTCFLLSWFFAVCDVFLPHWLSICSSFPILDSGLIPKMMTNRWSTGSRHTMMLGIGNQKRAAVDSICTHNGVCLGAQLIQVCTCTGFKFIDPMTNNVNCLTFELFIKIVARLQNKGSTAAALQMENITCLTVG